MDVDSHATHIYTQAVEHERKVGCFVLEIENVLKWG